MASLLKHHIQQWVFSCNSDRQQMWHEGWLVQDKTDNIVTMIVHVMSEDDNNSHCPNRNAIRLHKICLAGTLTAACAASNSWLRLLINWFSLSSWRKHSSFQNNMLLFMQSACVKKWTTQIWRMLTFMSTSVCPMWQMGLMGVQLGDSWVPDGVKFDPTSCHWDKSEQSHGHRFYQTVFPQSSSLPFHQDSALQTSHDRLNKTKHACFFKITQHCC